MARFLRPREIDSPHDLDPEAFYQRNDRVCQRRLNFLRQGTKAHHESMDITDDDPTPLPRSRGSASSVRSSPTESPIWDEGGRLLAGPDLPGTPRPKKTPSKARDPEAEERTAEFMQRNSPTKPALPPSDRLSFPPTEKETKSLHKFLDRQDGALMRKKEGQVPDPIEFNVYTIPRSQAMLERPQSACRPRRSNEKISFRPDRSVTSRSDPKGMSLTLVESQSWMKDATKQKAHEEGLERELEGCTWRPDLGPRERLNRYAGRAKQRERVRAELPPPEKEPEVDEEKLLRERRRAEEAKRPRGFKMPYKRETYTRVDLLISANRK
jgi:hypothetical protein